MAWLDENPPRQYQFRRPRRAPMSGAVGVHDTEGGRDLWATANFIRNRSDYGSYHVLVAGTDWVQLVDDNCEAFQIAEGDNFGFGMNATAWGISACGRASDWDPDDDYTRQTIDTMGAQIVAFWQRNGIDIASAARWLDRDQAKNREVGLFHHGVVQPSDRSDAWKNNPNRDALDQMLVVAVVRYAGIAGPAPAPAPPAWTPAPSNGGVWGVGSTGQKVRDIQTLLTNAGINCGGVDGIYGPRTAAGVTEWQRRLNISADGVWGPATDKATSDLFSYLASANQQPAPQTGVDLAALAAAIEAAKRQVLRRGARGDAVKWAQIFLNEHDAGIEADGIFGPATEAATRRFQQTAGLSADAVIGPKTWAALTA